MQVRGESVDPPGVPSGTATGGAAEEERPASSRGGQAVVEKYGKEHMAALGKRGSHAVMRKYGLRFYSEIAARNKGVKKRRKSDSEPAA